MGFFGTMPLFKKLPHIFSLEVLCKNPFPSSKGDLLYYFFVKPMRVFSLIVEKTYGFSPLCDFSSKKILFGQSVSPSLFTFMNVFGLIKPQSRFASLKLHFWHTFEKNVRKISFCCFRLKKKLFSSLMRTFGYFSTLKIS